MRIKLSKQNWRLVGQKMGWLKRAQIETGAGGVTSTGAAEAMGMGKDKITPGSLDGNKGNVDGGMKYNETPFPDSKSNIRLDQGLLTEAQSELLKDIDSDIKTLFWYVKPSEHSKHYIEQYFGSIKDKNGNRSGPVTAESLEEALKNWGAIDKKLEQGRNKEYGVNYHSGGQSRQTYNNYTPAQLQRFEKGIAERRQKLEGTKGLVRNAFLASMAGKPQLENADRFNLDTGDVKL